MTKKTERDLRRHVAELTEITRDQAKALWLFAEESVLRSDQIRGLFKAIAHGDRKHRAWLKAKIKEHFSSTAGEDSAK